MEDVEVSRSLDEEGQKEAESHDNDIDEASTIKARKDQFNRRGLLVCSCLSTTLYVGSWFGWGPMQLLLEENGSFHWKCGPEYVTLDDVCPAQSQSLLNVQLIASVTQILSPLVGWYADVYGAPKSACCMAACLWAGLLLWTISSSQTPSVSWDRVLFFANSLLAINVWFGGQLTVQAGLYFAGHSKSRVIFLLNALFDAGSITYLFLWWLATQVFSLSLAVTSAGYLVSSLVIVGAGLYFWLVAVPEADDQILIYGGSHSDDDDDGNDNPNKECTNNASAAAPAAERLLVGELGGPSSSSSSSSENSQQNGASSTTSIRSGDRHHLDTTTTTLVSSSEQPAQAEHQENDMVAPNFASREDRAPPNDSTDAPRQVSFHVDDNSEMAGKSQATLKATLNKVASRSDHGNEQVVITLQQQLPPKMTTTTAEQPYILVADRSPREQLLSKSFLLLCGFFSLHVTMNMWTLATTRDFLAYLGDDEFNNKYLTIFTLLLPASIVSVPLVDVIILRLGFTGGFQSINALALGYSIIRVATSNLDVQIVGFVLFSFYRCFLFGVSFSFLPQLLQQNVVGKGYGLVFLITGIVNALQIPLARLAIEELDGNFFIPNLVMLILVLPCIVAAWFLGHSIRLENKAKQRLRKSLGGGLLVPGGDRLGATDGVVSATGTNTEP